MCPYYLDGDRTLRFRGGSVIPVAVALIDATAMWLTVQFSKVAGRRPAGLAGRSLKTQQHAPAKASRYAALAGPGSVDILGRMVGDHCIWPTATKAVSRQWRRAVRAPYGAP